MQHRAVLGGATIALANLEMFAVVKTFPSLASGLGNSGLYLLYAASCLLAALFTHCCVPETSGVDLNVQHSQI